MKKGFVLLALVALFAATAQAETIPCASTGPVTIAADSDTTSDPTYDIVTITVTGITGGTDIVLLQGAWTAYGPTGTGFYVPGKATNWQGLTTYNNPGTSSFINLAAAMGTMDNNTPAYRTLVEGYVYSQFANQWYQTSYGGVTTDPGTNNGNVLAVLFVTKGWTQITLGDIATEQSKIALYGESLPHLATLTIGVPEPSTLALLGAGLVGLAAYAWRKRK